jgi:hypothetical protein
MIMAALANTLADEAMQRAFVDAQFEAVVRPMLAVEEFTASSPSLVTPDTSGYHRSSGNDSSSRPELRDGEGKGGS